MSLQSIAIDHLTARFENYHQVSWRPMHCDDAVQLFLKNLFWSIAIAIQRITEAAEDRANDYSHSSRGIFYSSAIFQSNDCKLWLSIVIDWYTYSEIYIFNAYARTLSALKPIFTLNAQELAEGERITSEGTKLRTRCTDVFFGCTKSAVNQRSSKHLLLSFNKRHPVILLPYLIKLDWHLSQKKKCLLKFSIIC